MWLSCTIRSPLFTLYQAGPVWIYLRWKVHKWNATRGGANRRAPQNRQPRLHDLNPTQVSLSHNSNKCAVPDHLIQTP